MCIYPCHVNKQFYYYYTANREIPLSAKKYFNARILNKDGRFARNIEYLFFAQYVAQQEQVYDSLSIALRKGRSASGEPINAGLLKDPQHKVIVQDIYAIFKLTHMLGSFAGSGFMSGTLGQFIVTCADIQTAIIVITMHLSDCAPQNSVLLVTEL